MILLPAIDMKDARCVRLKKGEFSTVSQVANSALETARAFAAAGARWVHMVDLDGARDGVRHNFPFIYEVIQQSGLSVELGGGIKNELDVITIGEAGADRMVIGSIIPLVPGVAFVNAIREIADGDYISGFVRMLDALLVFFCIAAGVGGGFFIIGQLRGWGF